MIRVLYIDDDPLDRALVKDLLEKESGEFEVTEAGSAAEFEACLAGGGYDVVLSDISILGLGGLEVIDQMRADRPGLPVVILTGSGSEEVAVEALQRGAADYVIKSPNGIRRLPHVLAAAIDRARAERERLLAEEQLRLSEERLRLALDGADMGTWHRNLLTGEVIWSERCRRMLGIAPDTAASYERFLGAIHPDDRDLVEAAVTRAIEERAHYGAEFRVRRLDGTTRWLASRGCAHYDDSGRPVRVEGVVLDITERKEAEELLQRSHDLLERKVAQRTAELAEVNARLRDLDRMKSEFLANMSHELRTPLNAIIGFSQLMYDGKVGKISSRHREYLNDILTSARHLLALINDVLDLSRIEAGRMELVLSEFTIDEVLAEVEGNLAPAIAAKGLRLIREVEPGCPAVTSDRTRLLQVLLNLAGNAVKFTERGEVCIRCRAAAGGRLQIAVSDTGIGIAPEQMKKLFLPFSQVDASLRRRHEGTGLGLYLSQKLASLLGGAISAESRYGQGSTFTLTIPQRPAGKPPAS
ncbi:MAG TPA: ATP-binding protein [candidate division Zixibacteria bacterium]|nr:ATP-binding protein [candidate division Zixibacteria bacterium]